MSTHPTPSALSCYPRPIADQVTHARAQRGPRRIEPQALLLQANDPHPRRPHRKAPPLSVLSLSRWTTPRPLTPNLDRTANSEPRADNREFPLPCTPNLVLRVADLKVFYPLQPWSGTRLSAADDDPHSDPLSFLFLRAATPRHPFSCHQSVTTLSCNFFFFFFLLLVQSLTTTCLKEGPARLTLRKRDVGPSPVLALPIPIRQSPINPPHLVPHLDQLASSRIRSRDHGEQLGARVGREEGVVGAVQRARGEVGSGFVRAG